MLRAHILELLRAYMSKLGTTVYNASQVADELNVSLHRVYALAKSRGVGSHLGRIWIFTQKDIEAMKERKPGNPRKVRT